MGDLVLSPCGDGYRYRLASTFRFYSSDLGAIVAVPKGFEVDLVSAPSLPLEWLIGGTGHERALALHDYLRRTTSRSVADRVFIEALGVCGTAPWRLAVYRAFARAAGLPR